MTETRPRLEPGPDHPITIQPTRDTSASAAGRRSSPRPIELSSCANPIIHPCSTSP